MIGILQSLEMVCLHIGISVKFDVLIDCPGSGYVILSVDLAHEYVKLGKTVKASTIYGQTLIVVRNNEPSAEVRTLFLLRYSESLALVNNVLRRCDEHYGDKSRQC